MSYGDRLKPCIVATLEKMCDLTFHIGNHWFAIKSSELNDRWGLNHWTPITADHCDNDKD